MGDLMDHPVAGKLLADLMKSAMSESPLMSSMGQMSDEMMAFMRNARLNDMLKMAGDAVPLKVKLQINQALNQIKK